MDVMDSTKTKRKAQALNQGFSYNIGFYQIFAYHFTVTLAVPLTFDAAFVPAGVNEWSAIDTVAFPVDVIEVSVYCIVYVRAMSATEIVG